MDVDRAMMTRCIQQGAVNEMISRGVSAHHFQTKTQDGQELADVLEWLSEFNRRNGQAPSLQLFRARWSNFRMEPTSDTLSSLIDAFFARVKRRIFSAKLTELAHLEQDQSQWARLDELMLDAARDLATVVPNGVVHRFSDMDKRVDRYVEEAANPALGRRYRMGIDPFDELTGGMRPGNLITIAGPSGKGKSLLTSWQLMNGYDQNATELFFALEMTAPEIFERLDTMVTNFSHKLLSQRQLPGEQVDLWRRIARQFTANRNDIVVLDNLIGCTTERIYADICRYRPDIVAVDYIQLMRTKQNYAAQWQSLVDITNDLKQIAVATDCVVIQVSQDGRDSFEHGSSETNVGGSIAIYQASDVYIGMHQTDEMYDDEQMEVRLLKNRRGGKMVGRGRSALLDWRPATMEFSYRNQDDVVVQASERFRRAS